MPNDMKVINQIIEKNKDKIRFDDDNYKLVAWILGQYIAENLRPDKEFDKTRGMVLIGPPIWDEHDREECEKNICIALAYYKLNKIIKEEC